MNVTFLWHWLNVSLPSPHPSFSFSKIHTQLSQNPAHKFAFYCSPKQSWVAILLLTLYLHSSYVKESLVWLSGFYLYEQYLSVKCIEISSNIFWHGQQPAPSGLSGRGTGGAAQWLKENILQRNAEAVSVSPLLELNFQLSGCRQRCTLREKQDV